MARGIASVGPAILSYGFRPFFLLAGIHAVVAMVAWIGALSGQWSVGGSDGPIWWHAHEMLFGYAAAALCGFILTAVPNWTGRLPVSGRPLVMLVLLWLGGRLACFAPQILGEAVSAAVDALFLPTLAFVVVREVVAGRNWQNLRVSAGIATLALLNVAFHACVLLGQDAEPVLRGTVALYVTMVCLIGGRIIPSFTRNYLVKRGATRVPAALSRFDQIALAATLVAGIGWALYPQMWFTSAFCLVAAALNATRLSRWWGYKTWREPLLLVLHVAYGFIALGYFAVGLSVLGLLSSASAIHVLTVGVVGMTTFAIMTRASRAHTGRALVASRWTTAGYMFLFSVAILRPLAEYFPDLYHSILAVSGLAWIAAFCLYLVEHAPMLARPSLGSRPHLESAMPS